MIHAAITAVALSFCTTISTTDDTDAGAMIEPGVDLKTIAFDGGSVSDYIATISTLFETDGTPANIVLFPGTERVQLPALAFVAASPGEALDVIADHVFTTKAGVQVSIEHELIGVESPVHRISGEEYQPRATRARTPGGSSFDEIDASILAVPAARLDAVLAISERALELVGLAERSTLVPVPEQGLLLVTGTSRGRSLVEDIVFAVLQPRPSAESGKQSRGHPTATPNDPASLKAELTKVAKLRQAESDDSGRRSPVQSRFQQLIREIRQAS